MKIRTTIKLVSCTILMLLFGLASCSNIAEGADQNGQDPDKGKTMSVELKFNTDNQLFSHKLGSEDNDTPNGDLTNQEVVRLSSGYFLFVEDDVQSDTPSLEKMANDNAIVKRVVKIVTQGQSSANIINVKDFDGKSCTIKGVPTKAGQLVILGNTDNKLRREIKYGDNLKDILSDYLEVKTQSVINDPQNQLTSLRDASLVGAAPIQYNDPTDKTLGGKMQIFLVPLVSRIEIKKVTNIKDQSGSLLEDYKLRGIYLDSIPVRGRVGGIWFDKKESNTNMFVIPDADVLRPTKAAEFTPSSSDFKYKDYQGYVCDYADWSLTDPNKTIGSRHQDAQGSPVYYTPANANKVWAYNFFAGYEYYERKNENGDPRDGAVINQIIGMPYITLNIGNTAPGYINTNLFLTVKNFYDKNKHLLNLAEPGKIYHLSELHFAKTDLHPDPLPSATQVNVTVSLMQWTTEIINPPAPE